jgi:hypothetical protein
MNFGQLYRLDEAPAVVGVSHVSERNFPASLDA